MLFTVIYIKLVFTQVGVEQMRYQRICFFFVSTSALPSKICPCACSATVVLICNTVCVFTLDIGSQCIINRFFRHHTYKKVDGQVELTEVGPRFEMKGKLYFPYLFFK